MAHRPPSVAWANRYGGRPSQVAAASAATQPAGWRLTEAMGGDRESTTERPYAPIAGRNMNAAVFLLDLQFSARRKGAKMICDAAGRF